MNGLIVAAVEQRRLLKLAYTVGNRIVEPHVYGLDGRVAFDFHRPAEYLFDDTQPEARTRGVRQVIVGPQMPYFHGGYPMEAPGVGIGNQEAFTYQCRAFLDQIAGTPDPLPANASFADALHTMQIIQAVVRSSGSGGAAVDVGSGTSAEPAGTAAAPIPAPPA